MTSTDRRRTPTLGDLETDREIGRRVAEIGDDIVRAAEAMVELGREITRFAAEFGPLVDSLGDLGDDSGATVVP